MYQKEQRIVLARRQGYKAYGGTHSFPICPESYEDFEKKAWWEGMDAAARAVQKGTYE